MHLMYLFIQLFSYHVFAPSLHSLYASQRVLFPKSKRFFFILFESTFQASFSTTFFVNRPLLLLYRFNTTCVVTYSQLANYFVMSCVSTDGQSVATRISRQVNRVTKLIRAHVEAYNTKEPESGCPTAFTFEEAIDTSNTAYLSALSEIQVSILFPCYAVLGFVKVILDLHTYLRCKCRL